MTKHRARVNALKKKGHRIFNTVSGKKIFILWFNRWTTAHSIAKAIYLSKKTKGGDASNFTQAINELGFLSNTKTKHSERSVIKKEEAYWVQSDKKYTAYRINLTPFYDYAKNEMQIKFNTFDKYIIELIFNLSKNRDKVISLSENSNIFSAIQHVIFDYLRHPLGEIKQEFLAWWGVNVEDENMLKSGLKELKILQRNITFQKFKVIEERIKKRKNEQPIPPAQNIRINRIYPLIYFVPASFITKIMKLSMHKKLYKIWFKNYKLGKQVIFSSSIFDKTS